MTEMPKLTRQAPGYYTGRADSPDSVCFVYLEQTDCETREIFGQHGWFWKIDGGATGHEISECVYSTKRDAEASLRANWETING